MKAIVHYDYGSPDILQCAEIEKPAPVNDEVLIKVRAASVNPLDCGSLRGVPYLFRVLFGLQKPGVGCPGRPGVDVAGEVEAVGGAVTQFRPGDSVFGVCISYPRASGAKVWVHRQGTFAEYVCASESTVVKMPENITFEQAASVPVAAFTALQGLRDKGRIQPGQRVLINGAAGGVGTFAVQIAKAFGAEVTAVCSSVNVDRVRSIGADHVVDYTRNDFSKASNSYHLIFDCVGNHSLRECLRVLAPAGVCVMVGELSGRSAAGIAGRLFAAVVLSRFTRRKLVTFLAKPDRADLLAMCEFLTAGKVRPVIDRCYQLSEVPQAIQYVSEKHACGKVVVRFA